MGLALPAYLDGDGEMLSKGHRRFSLTEYFHLLALGLPPPRTEEGTAAGLDEKGC